MQCITQRSTACAFPCSVMKYGIIYNSVVQCRAEASVAVAWIWAVAVAVAVAALAIKFVSFL